MKKKGTSGGNTITGLNFERDKDILSNIAKLKGYSVKGNIIFYNGKEVARSYGKYGLYKYLQSVRVEWPKIQFAVRFGIWIKSWRNRTIGRGDFCIKK
ncbi:MAG: hypothetical protein V2G42_03595 [bacterium JZ-2024 1]